MTVFNFGEGHRDESRFCRSLHEVTDRIRLMLWMRLFHVGNAVPDDLPRLIALTLELSNEVRLMGH